MTDIVTIAESAGRGRYCVEANTMQPVLNHSVNGKIMTDDNVICPYPTIDIIMTCRRQNVMWLSVAVSVDGKNMWIDLISYQSSSSQL